jgi:hypothetical protein
MTSWGLELAVTTVLSISPFHDASGPRADHSISNFTFVCQRMARGTSLSKDHRDARGTPNVARSWPWTHGVRCPPRGWTTSIDGRKLSCTLSLATVPVDVASLWLVVGHQYCFMEASYGEQSHSILEQLVLYKSTAVEFIRIPARLRSNISGRVSG